MRTLSALAIALFLLALVGLAMVEGFASLTWSEPKPSTRDAHVVGAVEGHIAYYVSRADAIVELSFDRVQITGADDGGGPERLGDSGLQAILQLTSIQRLDLSSTAVSGKGLGELAGLRSLKEIDISFSGIEASDMSALNELDQVEVLCVDETQIGERLVEVVPRMRSLGKLKVYPDGHASLSAATDECLNRIREAGVGVVVDRRRRSEIPI